LQTSASAEPVASRIIDRTLSCSVGSRAGVRSVTVSAHTGTRLLGDRSQWKLLAGVGASDQYASFAGVSAGNPLADLAPGVPAQPQRLYVAARPTCRTVARIPLTATGLARATASPLEDRYDCLPGRRVLVRVRGIFRAPTSLKPKRYADGVAQLAAAGTVERGWLAVRSQAGKPLAYAEVFGSGKARIFIARSCVQD
jgi:hypothetical protein